MVEDSIGPHEQAPLLRRQPSDDHEGRGATKPKSRVDLSTVLCLAAEQGRARL